MIRGAETLFGRIFHLLPVAFGVACLVPFVRLLVPDDTIISDPRRDYAAAYLPWNEFVRDELLAGRLPLWDPYLACGRPLHAAQQVSLFYVLSTPLVVAFGANAGLKLSLFAHLGICLTGVYLLARRFELSRLAACYAALVITWSGALMGHLAEGHVSMVFQSALVPWFFLALVDLLVSPDPIRTLRLAAVGSLCVLADHPQVLYYTFVVAMLWTAGSFCFGEAARQRWRVIGWGAAASAIVALTAAVQLVPAIELVRDGIIESRRGTAEFGATYALDGADSARLLMPYLNGTPFAVIPQFDPSDHYHERVVYLGIASPLLAAYGLSRATTARWQWGAAWGVVVALAVAFGDSTPAFGVLARALPGLSLFRCPGRIFCVASLPVALLAARGLDALARGEPRARKFPPINLLAVFLVAANLIAYPALMYVPSVDWQRYAQYTQAHLLGHLSLWLMLAAGATAILVLAAAGRLRGRAVSLLLIATAALDLGYFNVGNFRMERREPRDTERLPPADSMTRWVEASDFRDIGYDTLRYSRATRAAMREHHLAVGTNDGGVLPAATARLYTAIGVNGPPVLMLAACGFTWPDGGVTRARLDAALPRIRFLPEGLLDADVPVETITRDGVQQMKRVLMPVRLAADSPRDIDMEVESPRPGWLVVADTYYPGWICRVDGQIQPIELAHGVFRRVRIDAGRHRVQMSYEPLSFQIGLFATIAGVVVAAILFFAHLCRL